MWENMCIVYNFETDKLQKEDNLVIYKKGYLAD